MHITLIIISIFILLLFQAPIRAGGSVIITFADGRVSGGIRQSTDQFDSLGSVFVFDQKLLAEDAQTVIGRNAGYCIRTDPGAPDYSSTDHPDLPDDPDNNYGQCTWTLSFNKDFKYTGSITVSGREADLGSSMIPIVGGTGDFVGASGVLTSTPIPQDENGVLFRQELMLTNKLEVSNEKE
jgi:hypothetical protein